MGRLVDLGAGPTTEATAVFVDLGLGRRDPDWAYAVAKRSYRIRPEGGLEEVAPGALIGDPRAERGVPAQSDYWPRRAGTDITVTGSAKAVDARPFTEQPVELRIGSRVRRLVAYGRRRLVWRHGRPAMALEDEVTEVPLTPDYAYGGVDARVSMLARGEVLPDALAAVTAMLTFAGRYPRNPFGLGYVCTSDEDREPALPQLEDRDDLLDVERLIAEPTRWWRQPVPAYLSYQHPLMFPRVAQFGIDSAVLPDDDREVRELADGVLDGKLVRSGRYSVLGARQEAPPGLERLRVSEGAPISLSGTTAERPSIAFSVPGAPSARISIGGDSAPVEMKATVIRLEPDEALVHVVYAGIRRGLPRRYIRGVHEEIPLTAKVGGVEVRYRPPSVWDRSADPYTRRDQR